MKSARALAIIALTLSSAAVPAAAAEIALHEAVYRLTLKDLRLKGWSDTAGGILQMKVSRNCNFWMLDRKLEFSIKFTDGRRTHIIVNEKVRESVNGERFWFWSRTTVNGGTASIIAGKAARLITIKPEKNTAAEIENGDKQENEGPTLEDLVATPEELAQKAAEEAKKAEEEKAASAARGEKEEEASSTAEVPAGETPAGETRIAGGAGDGEMPDGESDEAAEAGPVEVEKDDDAIALAEAAAEAEAKSAIVIGEDGKPVGETQIAEAERVTSVISYDWPEAQDVEIPLDTIFPFTALQAQLDALSNGSLQRSFTIFDGSSPNGALHVLYRPVQSLAIAAIKPKGSVELLETTSWRYSATYLYADGKSKKPARIVIAQTHENGVISEMILDLGAFSIKGDLAWLKGTEAPICD